MQANGWVRKGGGRHQVKMVKAGQRPVTVPEYRGETLPVGLSQAILRQAGIKDD